MYNLYTFLSENNCQILKVNDYTCQKIVLMNYLWL